MRAAEDETCVKELVPPNTDDARSNLMTNPIQITTNTQTYNVEHVIHSTMKDLKLKKTWSGLGGADCILCTSRQEDWKNVEEINNGFPITRVAEETMLLFEQLSVEGGGEILKSPKDYLIRKGLTTKPLTTDNQHNKCINHSHINCLAWFMKLLYRCHTSYECWTERSTVIGEPIRRAKDPVQDIFKVQGLVLDQVGGANSKGGTSNDGNQASAIF